MRAVTQVNLSASLHDSRKNQLRVVLWMPSHGGIGEGYYGR